MRLHKRSLNAGFTLVELMAAAFIGLLTASTAGQIMVSHLETSERIEAFQRQREDWNRAASFIEAEVALSESIVTDPNKINLAPNCKALFSDPSKQLRFALNIRQDLYQSVYGVVATEENSGWLKPNSLWRCGPSFDVRGDYLSIEEEDIDGPSPQRLLDGLDNQNDTDNGFKILSSTSPGKLLHFQLSVIRFAKDEITRRFSFSSTGKTRTRISPLYSRPTTGSLCTASNMVKFTPDTSEVSADIFKVNISDSELPTGQDVLICGKGLVSEIQGSSYDDIIESGGNTGTTIYGCNGSDVIEGTFGIDNLSGDEGKSEHCPSMDARKDGDDILIGNGNASTSSETPEQMNGGNGFNRYVPGRGHVTITGGDNLDIVFFDAPLDRTNQKNYTFSTECNRENCTVTDQTETETRQMNLSGIEILIFPDQRIDLNSAPQS